MSARARSARGVGEALALHPRNLEGGSRWLPGGVPLRSPPCSRDADLRGGQVRWRAFLGFGGRCFGHPRLGNRTLSARYCRRITTERLSSSIQRRLRSSSKIIRRSSFAPPGRATAKRTFFSCTLTT